MEIVMQSGKPIDSIQTMQFLDKISSDIVPKNQKANFFDNCNTRIAVSSDMDYPLAKYLAKYWGLTRREGLSVNLEFKNVRDYVESLD